MVEEKYIPAQRDFVYVDFNPSSGMEIQKRRPALVVSNDDFNQATGFCIVCPVTETERLYPSIVRIQKAKDKKIDGYIMINQIKAIDYEARHIQYVEECEQNTWINVMEIIPMLFE